jgi:hypothetical protein
LERTPEALVSHSLPTRLRIKIPSRKRDAAYFAAVQEGLSSCPGVTRVEVNPLVGSVLVHYSGDAKSLAAHAKARRLFHVKAGKARRRSIMGEVAATFGTYNSQLKKMTGGELDLASLVFLSLVVSGVYQILRGNLTAPAWYTAFYYALGVFSHNRPVDEFDEGEDLLDDIDEGGLQDFDPGELS